MTPGASSSSKSEKRTETQEATSVKNRLTTKSSTEKRKPRLPTSVPNEDWRGQQTRRTMTCSGKESVHSSLTNTANTLLSDETGVLETNPWIDDSPQTKILTILHDPKEVKNGRQMDLNSLRGMGVVATVNRASAADKRGSERLQS